MVLQGDAKGFQGSQGRPNQVIGACALSLPKQGHQPRQQARQLGPYVIPQWTWPPRRQNSVWHEASKHPCAAVLACVCLRQ